MVECTKFNELCVIMGLVPSCNNDFVDISWAHIFSRKYFVGPQFLVGISWVQDVF